MFGIYTQRAERSLSAVAAHLQTSEFFRSLISQALIEPAKSTLDLGKMGQPPEPTEWRVIDHAAALSRTYAIYEQFVHELMREVVSFFEKTGPFPSLDAKFQVAYRQGIASISQRIDYSRYGHLSYPAIIADYASALLGKKYSLLSEAMLIHDKNLRMEELSKLFSPFGMESLEGAIGAHPDMISFFSGAERKMPESSSELRRFVQDRNESAHGGLTISEILGRDELVEYTQFCATLCKCLAEVIQKWVMETGSVAGQTVVVCRSKEVLKKGFVVIDMMIGTFERGDSLYISNGPRCYEAIVESIQIDGRDIDGLTAMEPMEIGFKLDVATKKGNKMYRRLTFLPETELDMAQPLESVFAGKA